MDQRIGMGFSGWGVVALILIVSGCDSKPEPVALSPSQPQTVNVLEEVEPERPKFQVGTTTLSEVEEVFGPSEAKEDTRVWKSPDPSKVRATRLIAKFDAEGVLEGLQIAFEGVLLKEAIDSVKPILGEIPLRRMISGDSNFEVETLGYHSDGSQVVFVLDLAKDFKTFGLEKPGSALNLIKMEPEVTFVEAISTPAVGPYFGERIRLGEFEYLIAKLFVTDGVGKKPYAHRQASKGAAYIVVSYTIENVGQRTATTLASDLELVDSQGRTFTASSEATTAVAMANDVDLVLSQLQPGIPRELMIVFEVPEKVLAQPLKLVIPEKGLAGTKRVEIDFLLANFVVKGKGTP